MGGKREGGKRGEREGTGYSLPWDPFHSEIGVGVHQPTSPVK